MWACGIGECDHTVENAEGLLLHQANSHERHRCAICGTIVPDGYFAIRHAFSEHSRAEYLRNYDADTADIRFREAIRDEVEEVTDIESVVQELGSDGQNGIQEQ